MHIAFEKYEACGNDFLFLAKEYCISNIIQAICDRNFGVGADGVITSNTKQFLYFNRDGTQAEMCGNGIRCFILHQFQKQKELRCGYIEAIHSKHGYRIQNVQPFEVDVNMGNPYYVKCDDGSIIKDKKLLVNDNEIQVSAVYATTPHIVVQGCGRMEQEQIAVVEEIYKYNWFNSDANIDFVYETANKVFIRTYERGCGFTRACSSGATAVYWLLWGNAKYHEKQEIYFDEKNSVVLYHRQEGVHLVGSAKKVMEGTYIYE